MFYTGKADAPVKFVDTKTDSAFKKIFGNEAHKGSLIEFLT
jgi:hypothetical protein